MAIFSTFYDCQSKIRTVRTLNGRKDYSINQRMADDLTVDSEKQATVVGDPQRETALNQVELAQRIKKLRIKCGFTIDEAAVRAGLTGSWWSKVESFRITPSLPALVRLASTLGTSISQLLEGLDAKPQLIVVAPDEGFKFRRNPDISDIEYESLAQTRPNRRMDPLLLRLAPGGGRAVPMSHEGEEFLMVLAGRVVLEYGTDRVELSAGYSAYFDSNVEHRLNNPFDEEARVLCVFDGNQLIVSHPDSTGAA
jgi:mannose-6-phosphate isomerase-like protein (cupin superfamily)